MNINVSFEGYISDSLGLGTIENELNNIITNSGLTSTSPDIVLRTHPTENKWAIACTFSGELPDGADNTARDALQTSLDAQVESLVFKFGSDYGYIEE